MQDAPPGDASTGVEGIALVPFTWEHCRPSALMTLREFPLPENLLAVFSVVAAWGVVGVAAVDEADGAVAGYFVGNVIPPFNSGLVGLGRKRVANLKQICVSSRYQKRGIAQRMARFLLDGRHPDFDPDDYDEIVVQDTDALNSPSWLATNRVGFRYFPTHEMICCLGLSGYLQLLFTSQHILPGQFMKRLVKSEEEEEDADESEKQKGVLACFVSGLLPSACYIGAYALHCKWRGGFNSVFAACVFGAVYLMLLARFLLAHLLTPKSMPPVFREYDLWWSPYSGWLGWGLTIFKGFPLLGWTGGFYLGAPDANYRKPVYRRAIGLLHLPIGLLTLALFLAHTLLRILRPGFLSDHTFLDVLGTASFFFSVTDIAMLLPAFPSGAVAIRQWNAFVYAGLLISWLALLIVTNVVPKDAADFLDLSSGACKA